jgi:F-type H+-transporting ATPase subunit O
VFDFLQPLDDALKTDLESALKSFLKQGEKLLLTVKVDPEIIGGMIVSIGDKYVDMSIASKVKRYTDVITAAV